MHIQAGKQPASQANQNTYSKYAKMKTKDAYEAERAANLFAKIVRNYPVLQRNKLLI